MGNMSRDFQNQQSNADELENYIIVQEETAGSLRIQLRTKYEERRHWKERSV